MELRVLQYFLAVAEEGSLSGAAERLNITQPTLSRQLAGLEEELGTQLYHRGSRGVALTEDGLRLKLRAQEILSLEERTRAEITGGSEEVRGEIAIGCAETGNMRLLSVQLERFREAHPGVVFHIRSTTADQALSWLDDGLLDLALLIAPVDTSRYTVMRLPFSERFGVWVRTDSPLAKKKEIGPDDLLDTPLILPERASVRSELQQWFGVRYGEIQEAATYTLILNALMMAENGMGAVIGLDLGFPSGRLSFLPLQGMPPKAAVLCCRERGLRKGAPGRLIDDLRQWLDSSDALKA